MKYSILTVLAFLTTVVSRDFVVSASRSLRASPPVPDQFAGDGDAIVNSRHEDFVPYFFPHYQPWRYDHPRDDKQWNNHPDYSPEYAPDDKQWNDLPYYSPQDEPNYPNWEPNENDRQGDWDLVPRDRDRNGFTRHDFFPPGEHEWEYHPQPDNGDWHYPPQLSSARVKINPLDEDNTFDKLNLYDNFDPSDDESEYYPNDDGDYNPDEFSVAM